MIQNQLLLLTIYIIIRTKFQNSTKKDALSFLEQILKKEYPNEQITQEFAEDTLQYLIFDLNKSVPFPAPKNPKFKFIDLFAGIGGFRIAMQNLGGKCIYTSEWNKEAQKTYRENFGEIPFGDITKERVKKLYPQINLIYFVLGFPCQGFFNCRLWKKVFQIPEVHYFLMSNKIIEKHRPKVVFLENVKNLVSHDKGKTFKIIIEILEKRNSATKFATIF